jgi:MoaA/NifB/PqqE/SkfB family radical SAM enzyme
MDDGDAIRRQNRIDAEKLDQEGRYALSPLVRLLNYQDCIKLIGWEGVADYNLPHAEGIVLALCDGRRTLRDIAEAVIPFVREPHDGDVLMESLRNVQNTVCWFLKDKEEQQGRGPSLQENGVPSHAVLVPGSLLSSFRGYRGPAYDPRLFVPKYAKPSQCDRSIRDTVPAKLTWHFTDACSTDCRYCYLGRRKMPSSEHLPFHRVVELLDECKRIGVCEITPAGGDILLYPHLFDLLDALDDTDFLPVRLVTKAYCSRETARRLAAHPKVLELQFSIDSAVAAVADYLTRCPGFCHRTLESIRNATEAGLRVAVKSVITPYNILTIPDLYREVRRRGVKPVRLAMYVRSGYHHTDDLFNHEETADWLLEEIETLKKEFPDDQVSLQNGVPVRERAPQETVEKSWAVRSVCSAGRKGINICADGKVIPCEQMPEIGEMWCGDLKTQSIQEVWDGRELAERTFDPPRERFRDCPCYTCGDFEECVIRKGYCIRDTYQYQGALYTTPLTCPKYEGEFVRTL